MAELKGTVPEKIPTTAQVLTVITLLPIGGILLIFSGITLTGSIIGLAVATPVFILFSPIIVPAAIVLTLGVVGFLTSGAFGLIGLSSLTWLLNYFRDVQASVPEQIQQVKRRVMETAGHVGQRTKEMGQGLEAKAREGARGA